MLRSAARSDPNRPDKDRSWLPSRGRAVNYQNEARAIQAQCVRFACILLFQFVSGQTRNECRCSGKGSFFKPHVDTPRSEMMFGSLVIVFPTPHEGGGLLFRHRGHEWIFDSGKELADAAERRQPSVAYVAFYSDIEHEVAPVISGYRVTLTFNLYIEVSGPVSAKDTGSEEPSLPPATNERPQKLADGDTVASG